MRIYISSDLAFPVLEANIDMVYHNVQLPAKLS